MLHIVVDQFLLIMKMPTLILVIFLRLDDSHLISFVGVLFFGRNCWLLPVPERSKCCVLVCLTLENSCASCRQILLQCSRWPAG
jgi:hypothetical protein